MKNSSKLRKSDMLSSSEDECFSDDAERMAAEIDEDIPVIKTLRVN